MPVHELYKVSKKNVIKKIRSKIINSILLSYVKIRNKISYFIYIFNL